MYLSFPLSSLSLFLLSLHPLFLYYLICRFVLILIVEKQKPGNHFCMMGDLIKMHSKGESYKFSLKEYPYQVYFVVYFN